MFTFTLLLNTTKPISTRQKITSIKLVDVSVFILVCFAYINGIEELMLYENMLKTQQRIQSY